MLHKGVTIILFDAIQCTSYGNFQYSKSSLDGYDAKVFVFFLTRFLKEKKILSDQIQSDYVYTDPLLYNI